MQSIEYEITDGLAELAKIKLNNPTTRDEPYGVLTDLKIFQPGNEISIWMGYGGSLAPVGRVQIVRPKHRFTADSSPTLELVGYGYDHKMMDDAPDRQKDKRAAGEDRPVVLGPRGGQSKKKIPPKRVFPKGKLSEVLFAQADRYNMVTDFDEFDFGRGIVQKPGMSDYDLCKGLSNLAGNAFWVDYDFDSEQWVMHSKDLSEAYQLQDRKYTFKYNSGDESSLLNFEPESVLRNQKTKIRVETRNPQTGKTIVETFDVLSDGEEEEDIAGDENIEAKIAGPLKNAALTKLFFGDFALTVVANKAFKTRKELRDWARIFFLEHRADFITGTGRLIGVENLRARQTHALQGIGVGLSGDYEFVKVRHHVSKESGYHTTFTARKVLK